MDEKTIRKLNTIISVVFIAAALFFFGAALKNRSDKNAEPSKSAAGTSQAASGEAQLYEDLDGMKSLELAKDFPSWTPGAQVEAEKVDSGILQASGKVAKAYLNIKASVGGKPLSKYESFFLKFNDIGGHLFRPQSLKTPEYPSTSLLYDLREVAILPNLPYDENRAPEKADLAAALLDGKKVKLTAFISSLRPAQIEEMSISYVCVGGSECAITLK
jgi:hypothetical protein